MLTDYILKRKGQKSTLLGVVLAAGLVYVSGGTLEIGTALGLIGAAGLMHVDEATRRNDENGVR